MKNIELLRLCLLVSDRLHGQLLYSLLPSLCFRPYVSVPMFPSLCFPLYVSLSLFLSPSLPLYLYLYLSLSLSFSPSRFLVVSSFLLFFYVNIDPEDLSLVISIDGGRKTVSTTLGP